MKTNLMKSILHLKDDTEYQIPLRETEKDDRAEVGTTKENEADVEVATTQLQDEQKLKKDQVGNNSTAKKETDEISQEEVDDAERPALETVEKDPDETQNQEHPNTEESNSDTNTESVSQVDSAKAALDEMKKLASQEGVIHPSLFISNFSKILGLMERAMQLQVKESGSVTKESDSAKEEKAPETTTEEKTTEQTETPAEG